MTAIQKTSWQVGLSLFVGMLLISGLVFWLAPGSQKISKNTLEPTQIDYVLVSKNCWFSPPEDVVTACGELLTPSISGQFRLPYVILRDTSSQRRPDPVIYLQGGPGGAAGMDQEGIAHWAAWREGAGLQRDLILFDIRGAGMSQPALTCANYDRFTLRALRENLTMEDELAQGFAVIKECFADLSSQGFSIEQYGTQLSAQDLRALMSLLSERNPDYKYWNLVGVSYGSRLAMVAASEYPAIKALVLDSAYPLGYGGAQSWPAVFDGAVKRFFSWCEKSTDCNPSSRPDLLQLLALSLQQLKDQPIELSLRRWNGEAPVNLVLNDHRFLSAAFFALYSPHDWVHLVPAMEGLASGDRKQLNSLMESFINNALSDDFNGLVFMAVDCRDHPVQSQDEYQGQLEKFPLFAEYMQHLWTYQACHLFPAGGGLPQMDTPTQPALILAGELDPITPVEWAETLHAQWPRSQLVRFSGTGHAVINHQPCVYSNLGQYLDDPERAFSVCANSNSP